MCVTIFSDVLQSLGEICRRYRFNFFTCISAKLEENENMLHIITRKIVGWSEDRIYKASDNFGRNDMCRLEFTRRPE